MVVLVYSPGCHPQAEVRYDYFEGPGKSGWIKNTCAECGAILCLVPTRPIGGKRVKE